MFEGQSIYYQPFVGLFRNPKNDFKVTVCILGEENYENQKKYGSEVFKQLNDLKRKGCFFQGKWHKIDLVCCCDWKCGALIEGLNGVCSKYFCRFCLCTKELLRSIRGNYALLLH